MSPLSLDLLEPKPPAEVVRPYCIVVQYVRHGKPAGFISHNAGNLDRAQREAETLKAEDNGVIVLPHGDCHNSELWAYPTYVYPGDREAQPRFNIHRLSKSKLKALGDFAEEL